MGITGGAKRHKHADLIIAWAEGAEIEYLNDHKVWTPTGGLPAWAGSVFYRVKPKLCKTCKKELNTSDPLREDCGGDCLECMAQAGDPDCIKAVSVLKR